MGYYTRRTKRIKALRKDLSEMSEQDPLVKFVNNAKDIVVLTLTVAAALIAVSALQRSFWAGFRRDT
jgi:hypothetical protein